MEKIDGNDEGADQGDDEDRGGAHLAELKTMIAQSKLMSEGRSGHDKDERSSQGEAIGSCDSPRDMRASSSDDGDLQEEQDDVKDIHGELMLGHAALTNAQAKDDAAPGNAGGPMLPGGWRGLENLDSLPLMKSGYSLEADMKFGWKPRIKGKVLPIPLIFNVEDEYFTLDHYIDHRDAKKGKHPTIFSGWRPADSLKMYRRLLNNTNRHHGTDFPFKLPGELPPAVQRLLDQQMQERILGGSRTDEAKGRPDGMHPEFRTQWESGAILQFDSAFESGNLDRVVMVSPTEYDLYMRPDTNARGHHQWFYFRVTSRSNLGPVRFNIVNFTKRRSLYENGMRVCVCSLKDKESQLSSAKTGLSDSPLGAELAGWKRGGYDIKYQPSKLNRIIERSQMVESHQAAGDGGIGCYPRFFQLSFMYDFNMMAQDETYFAYSFPYTFTRLTRFLKELKADPEVMKYAKDCTPLCSSLSGVDVPYLTITSRVNEPDFEQILESEHSPDSLPVLKTKKTVVLTGRVHPGESNASFMMEGFIKFLTSPTNPIACELRKRTIFRIIPCTNPDGVIAGNYRVSMSGNDLNRRYQSPHARLHPIVCAVKKLIRDLKPDLQVQDENQVLAFIDMHGHSRKKNVFMYGPGFPIHDARYLKMRVMPKLMSEQSEMFRFYSCKFRIQRSKEKTARVVLWREFNIMNCYTLEASFHGFFDRERETKEFLHSHLLQVGKMLASTIFEYALMRDDEERHLQGLRAKREEVKRSKAKAAANGTHPLKIKEESGSKAREGSLGGGPRAVLSPSASSEAITNIDDQQPDPALPNKKINHIRKKLLHAQQNKKQLQSTTANKEMNEHSSSTKAAVSGQKKKFKLTKKFKDDVMPPAAPKKRANPNQPPEEAEEVEEIENGQEGSSNEEDQAASKINRGTAKPDTQQGNPGAAPDLGFVAKFKLNRRTLADLCNQIETEEQKAPERNREDAGSSDGGATTDGGRGGVDAYGSDDEVNGMLLQKIQGKILGVLKLDASVPPTKPQKPVQAKDQKPKKPLKSKAAQPLVTAVAKVHTQGPANHPKSDKKTAGALRSQDVAAKKQNAARTKDQRAQLGGERRSHQTGAVLRRPEDGVPENTRERARPRLAAPASQSAPLAFSTATGASAPHPPQQHYSGILLQLTNNNFNDRIMTQPYHKYKKPKYPGLSGGLHQLQSLTANAHQLLQKQIQREKGQGQARDPYKLDASYQTQMQQHAGDVSADGVPKYSFYNFQARNGNERSIPLVAGGSGGPESVLLPASSAVDGGLAERRSHGPESFGKQHGGHRYQFTEMMGQTNHIKEYGRPGFQDFGSSTQTQFGKHTGAFNSNNHGGGMGAHGSGPAQQLHSQPLLNDQHDPRQIEHVYLLPSQPYPAQLPPQLMKHPTGTPAPNTSMMAEQDRMQPDQYQMASMMQRSTPLEQGLTVQEMRQEIRTQPGQMQGAAFPRSGISAGGFKRRNRRLLPAGEQQQSNAIGGQNSGGVGDTPMFLVHGGPEHDLRSASLGLQGAAGLVQRQSSLQRLAGSELAEKMPHFNNRGLQPAANSALVQYAELNAARAPGNPASAGAQHHPATSSAAAVRLAEPLPQATRPDLAALSSMNSAKNPPLMWCDASQQFQHPGRAHLVGIAQQELTMQNVRQRRDGSGHLATQAMTEQLSSEQMATDPQSKAHTMKIQELYLPQYNNQFMHNQRTYVPIYAQSDVPAATTHNPDLAIFHPMQMPFPRQLPSEQIKSEYHGTRPGVAAERAFFSQRKEAKFEYPTLPTAPSAHPAGGHARADGLAALVPPHQADHGGHASTNLATRDADAQGVMESLTLTHEAGPKATSSQGIQQPMSKASKSVAKEPAKDQQKQGHNQSNNQGRLHNQTAIMVRGIGAARVTAQGPFLKDTPSQASMAGLRRESSHSQFASQLSLLKEGNTASEAYQAQVQHQPGLQTRGLVAAHPRALEGSGQKVYEQKAKESKKPTRKGGPNKGLEPFTKLSILTPVLGSTERRKHHKSGNDAKVGHSHHSAAAHGIQGAPRYSNGPADQNEGEHGLLSLAGGAAEREARTYTTEPSRTSPQKSYKDFKDFKDISYQDLRAGQTFSRPQDARMPLVEPPSLIGQSGSLSMAVHTAPSQAQNSSFMHHRDANQRIIMQSPMQYPFDLNSKNLGKMKKPARKAQSIVQASKKGGERASGIMDQSQNVFDLLHRQETEHKYGQAKTPNGKAEMELKLHASSTTKSKLMLYHK